MRLYAVYFELYGKKMKVKVMASSPESAREIVKGSIRFDKIEILPPDEPKRSFSEDIRQMFDNLNPNK